MYPILFKAGIFEVHAYGFFIALAFIIGIMITLFYTRREGIDPQIVFDLAIYVLLSAIVGSRLFYVIGAWDQFKDNWPEMFMVQRGGLVFLGGFIFCLITVLIYCRLKKIPVFKLFDAIAPATALGYSITRIGCFLNSCCFGLPTALPWGIKFPLGSLADSYFPGESLHPTQLYSMLSMLLVFVVLVLLYRKKSFDGQIFMWWFVFYAVYRFAVEAIRYCPIYWLGLTPAQWMVIPLFIYGVWGLWYHRRKPGA